MAYSSDASKGRLEKLRILKREVCTGRKPMRTRNPDLDTVLVTWHKKQLHCLREKGLDVTSAGLGGEPQECLPQVPWSSTPILSGCSSQWWITLGTSTVGRKGMGVATANVSSGFASVFCFCVSDAK